MEAMHQGMDQSLTASQCVFLYMPLMHSEDLDDQERGIALYEQRGLHNNVTYAIAHRDIIVRFGRFPHRNAALGRRSTDEELAFLQERGSSF